jgi:trigger factor
MTANVERLEGLKCRIEVTLPANDIEVDIEQRLRGLASKVNIKGFRQGHVPMAELRRRFGKNVREEVVNEKVIEVLQTTLDEQDIRPAGYPSIEHVASELKDQIRCLATFDVFPEVVVAPLTGVALQRITSDITESDVEDMLKDLCKQHIDWIPVERPIKEGDQLIIDFDGLIDGEPLDRGSAKGYNITIGDNTMIPGFEAGLLGKKVDDQFVLNLSFPEDYFEKAVAGKPVDFNVTIQKVSEPLLPTLDDQFAERLKVKGGVEGLRNEVRKNLEREIKFRSKNMIKQKLVDKLLELNQFEVPYSLVEEEVHSMMDEFKNRTGQELAHDHGHSEFDDRAAKRVRTGLIFSEVIKQHKIQPTDERVEERLQEMASSFDNPEQVIGVYKSNERLLNSIRNEILEDMVVEHLLKQASVSTKALSFDEFKNYSDKDED